MGWIIKHCFSGFILGIIINNFYPECFNFFLRNLLFIDDCSGNVVGWFHICKSGGKGWVEWQNSRCGVQASEPWEVTYLITFNNVCLLEDAKRGRKRDDYEACKCKWDLLNAQGTPSVPSLNCVQRWGFWSWPLSYVPRTLWRILF